jgi:exonuclease III
MKIISINIEGRRHLDSLKAFFKQERPDVICMQELDKQDLALFEEVTGMPYAFTPMFKNEITGAVQGIGIFANGITEYRAHFVGGFSGDSLPTAVRTSLPETYNSILFQVLVATIAIDNTLYTIATTHLPVTEDGLITDYQREAFAGLEKALAPYGDIVLCGDFNTPRGRELFTKLSETYTDNIPATYVTSLDQHLHRNGYIPYVVDGLFTTPHYVVAAVELKNGISDHLAIVGHVKKV